MFTQQKLFDTFTNYGFAIVLSETLSVDRCILEALFSLNPFYRIFEKLLDLSSIH